VEKVWLLGTQALREADNGLAFAAEVKARTGFDLEIISGQREAYLSYAGALKGFADDARVKPLVLDIGAGSTELFFEDTEGAESSGDAGDRARRIKGASAPVGCLRLLEKPMDGDGILAALRSGWPGLTVPPEGSGIERPLVAVGGTATTLGAIHLKMEAYDPDALLGLRMGRGDVEAVIALLEGLSSEERLALPGMMPGREDVMPWGLRILLAAMAHCRKESAVICDRDLLYGVLYE
jgi:exopolyphosphatase/guanosine-5'-triphosphate,3'-diphosphate pyrophosphatase